MNCDQAQEQEVTVRQIAQALGISVYSVHSRLLNHGISFRFSPARKGRPFKLFKVESLPDDIREALAHPKGVVIDTRKVPEDGPLGMDAAIRKAITHAIKSCRLPREHIASEMARLIGRPISKAMLNSFTSAVHSNRFPASHVAAFEAVTKTRSITELIAKAGGHVLVSREEAYLLEIGRMELRIRELQAELRDTPAR